MKDTLKQLKKVIDIGFVGGSDANKIREQLDEETISLNDYFFSENGLVAVKGSELIAKSVTTLIFRALAIF
jgi:phosphomannomutase